MSKKNPLIQSIGETIDGKLVYKGVYKFYETTGVPLDVLFDCISRKGVVSWYHFYMEALSAGMEYNRILSKIEEAVCDVWGAEYMSSIKTKSEQMMDFYNKLKLDEIDEPVICRPKNVVRTFPYVIKPDKIIIIKNED